MGPFRGMKDPFGGVKGPLEKQMGPPSSRAPSLKKLCVRACSLVTLYLIITVVPPLPR